ncbi:MAG: TrkH family potassium uptake protein [Emergencia sp.]
MAHNYRVILRTISVILLFEGTAMLVPVACAVYYGESGPASALFFTAICCIAFGLTVYRHLKYYTLKIRNSESYFIAFLCWFTVCLAGTLPYALADCGYSYVDCIFESVSGWTTTGAWTLDLNEMPRSLILWKAITNWLGGMGLLLLTISFFPVLGVEGQKMAAAEVPGPEFEKMSARISDTAKISYRIYILLTVTEFLLLLPSGLTPFESLVNTMSTISTAGLLSLDGNIVVNFTPYVKAIITIFSIAGSVNFMMYFFMYLKKWNLIRKNIEVRTYLGLLAGGAVLIALPLRFSGYYDSFLSALGDAFVQAVAFGATSGFEVCDINTWPTLSKMVLLCLLFIGGCANSTSGSIKVIRFIIFFKIFLRGVYKRIHPRAVRPVMIQGKPVSAAGASSVTVFLLLYFAIFIAGSVLFSLENMDMETTLCTTLACLTNNGTGFGSIAGGDFSIFSSFGKLLSSVLMISGRLELYAIVMLFSRSFWNPDRARS